MKVDWDYLISLLEDLPNSQLKDTGEKLNSFNVNILKQNFTSLLFFESLR